MSKQEQIEKHLLKGQTITGLQAIELFGVYRLSSVINRLRHDKKLPIETSMILSGDGVTLFAKYWIPINKR
mgnify:CR=1 FL=1|tara:strand:- start:16671 stop:16883 length:213 start_codon:yes stop_codon:yes gene_type:complete